MLTSSEHEMHPANKFKMPIFVYILTIISIKQSHYQQFRFYLLLNFHAQFINQKARLIDPLIGPRVPWVGVVML